MEPVTITRLLVKIGDLTIRLDLETEMKEEALAMAQRELEEKTKLAKYIMELNEKGGNKECQLTQDSTNA